MWRREFPKGEPKASPQGSRRVVSRLPNLLRYGRGLVASNLGVAEFTTVILYGSRRLICLPSLLT